MAKKKTKLNRILIRMDAKETQLLNRMKKKYNTKMGTKAIIQAMEDNERLTSQSESDSLRIITLTEINNSYTDGVYHLTKGLKILTNRK